MGRRDGTSAGAVLRAGSSSGSTAWQLMAWFVGVIPRPFMRAIAPEREWDGRRWSRGRISARRTAFGPGAVCSPGNGKRGRKPIDASPSNQRVSSEQFGKGGRPGCSQETCSGDSGVPVWEGARLSAFYIPCVHRASCHRSAGALWWGPQMTHRSRARQSLCATSSLSPCLDRD